MNRLSVRASLAAVAVAAWLASAQPVLAAPAIIGPPQFQGDVYSAHAAATRAHALLGYLRLPMAATPGPSIHLLPAQHDRPASNFVVRSRWWTVAMTPAAFGDWLAGNVPYGFWAPTRSTSPNGEVRLHYESQATYPSYTGINVTYLPVSGHVVARVDSVVTWRPPRSPAELVPYSTPVVEVLVTSGRRHATVKHVLARGPELSKLNPWLDYAQGYPPGQPACPGTGVGRSYRLTYRIGHRVVLFAWADSGCDVVQVTVNGRRSVPLAGRPSDLVDYMVGLG